MDEYEVDLREYFLILWKGKWIVSGVLVLALAVAAALTLRTPAQFQAEVLLAVGDPLAKGEVYTPPTTGWIVERVRDPAILDRATASASVSSEWLSGALTAAEQGPFVRLAVQGTRPRAELAAVLDRVVVALHEDLAAEVARAAERRLAEVQTERERLRARLAAWEEELDRVRAATEASRDRLREEIARVQDDPALRTLRVGGEATIQGYVVQKELDLLYARLQSAELALDQMGRAGPSYVAGTAWEGLVDQLGALDEEETVLRGVWAEPPSPVSVVRGPVASGPLRPSLKMNLAVAGVLGLFVGVLLVFLIHALRAPTEEPRHTGRTPGQESGG
ncbi:MAG TPA: hypothetical protein ENN53_00330 [Candidatus Acetothermia bacterium]|nr:hypothetical protein [Candidatus Acetothermia bacterium]